MKDKGSSNADPQSVAARSREYRASTGMNQRQLAAKLLTSPGVIGELERGKIRSRRVAELVMELPRGT